MFTNEDCTFLVRENKDRMFFNHASVIKLDTKKYNIPAIFGPPELSAESSKISMKDFNRLERNLVLCRKSRVLVNQNLNTGLGICNGSLGTV